MQSRSMALEKQRGIIYENILMTPQLAAEYLACNIDKNRKKSPTVIARYESDIRSGNWEQNGETIKFDEDGNMVDGQHRLLAIINTGISVWVTVAWGIKRKAIKTIDRGKMRSVGDTFKMEGKKNASLMAAIVAWNWRWINRNPVPKQARMSLTTTMAEQILLDNPGIEDSAHFAAGIKTHFIGLCPISLIGFCHFIFSQLDRGQADEFMERLAKGDSLTANHPILKLRERMRSISLSRYKAPDYDILAITILAWNAVRRGRLVYRQRLYWHEKEQSFPHPK